MAQLVVAPFPRVRTIPSWRPVLRVAMRFAYVALALVGAGLALVTIGPRLLPYQALPVLTGSMEPAVPAGSLAIVVPVHADEVAVGDVITFTHPLRPSAYVTHRVVAIENGPTGRVFVTKGDANALPDEWRVAATGDGWRLALVIPRIGGLLVSVATSSLRLVLLAIPMVVLAAMALVDIWRPRPTEVHAVRRAA